MSDFDSNPFADPEAANPFSDPSVRQATHPGQHRPAGLDDYNPFADQQTTTRQAPATQPQTAAVQPQPYRPPPPQPAVMQPTEQPPAYTPSAAQQATADLQKRQEELERKAAELQRKEQEMNRANAYQTRQNNFPPLPDKCCVHPCFYQDFSVDIPLEFQRMVKTVYYFWLFHVCTLFLNVLGALAYFIASVQGGTSNSSGVTFGLSILFFVLFTPCSFICWYRPLYKAFRSDSSFNFFVFFFIFFFQFCVNILQCLGIDGWGTCGIINGLGMITKGHGGPVVVGTILIVMGLIFGLTATAAFIILIKVHRIYRSTGASFDKAKQEFAQGVMTNRDVQQAAGQAAAAGARAAVQQNMGGNRY